MRLCSADYKMITNIMRLSTINLDAVKKLAVPLAVLASLMLLRAWDPLHLSDRGMGMVLSNNDLNPSADIVVLDIDVDSQRRYGTWPFDRKDLGTLVSKLKSSGASVVVLNLPLSDPDRARGDEDLAKALNSREVILTQSIAAENKNTAYPSRKFAGLAEDDLLRFNRHEAMAAPLSKLAQNAAGTGTENFYRTNQYHYLQYPLILNVNDQARPSVILEAMRHITQETKYDFKSTGRGTRVSLAQFLNISADGQAEIYINYDHEFKTIKLSDNSFSLVKNKIVIVGSSIPGVNAWVSTPLGQRPSHYIHAHALQTVLDGATPVRSNWIVALELIMALALAMILWYSWNLPDRWVSMGKMALAVSITLGVPFVALSHANLLFDPVWPTIIAISTVVAVLIQRHRRLVRCILCQWICGAKA